MKLIKETPNEHHWPRQAVKSEGGSMTKIKPKARIFIVLEGGLVQSVFCDVPAQVVVADYDTSESDPDELTRVGDDRAHVSAYPSEEWSEIEPATARDISRHSDWWLHT